MTAEEKNTLCVDLDGTLIQTDMLYESFVSMLWSDPLRIPCVPFWLLRGRAHLKRQLAKRASVDPELLPYNEEVLEFVREERAAGRKIVLATASDHLLVEPLARHLGLFDEVLASDGELNLKGTKKSKVLVERFGEKGFDYAGDSAADLVVWQKASSCIVVSRGGAYLEKMKEEVEVSREFQVSRSPLILLRAMRVHQWVKNLLLFVPLVMAHRLTETELLFQAFFAFISFSLCASSVYLLNDMADLEADRKHPSKKNRPLASGQMPLSKALLLAPLLLVMSFLLASVVNWNFFMVLGLYLIITSAYSFGLKRIAVLDIVTLATLYTVRILAGGYAVSVPVSPWLLAFSMFLFFSLACVKRYSELLTLKHKKEELVAGRGYRASDLEQLASFGAASGYIAVLVMALYINSEEVTHFYATPSMLWLICPILLYWVSRVWLLAHRDEMHEDPIVFAIKDRVSYLVGLLCMGIIILAL